MLIDAATGAQILARDVPGLFFPLGPPTMAMPGQSAPTVMPGPSVSTPLGGYQPQNPYGSNYPRQTPFAGPGGVGMPPAITASYVCSAVGIVLVCCAPFLTALAGLLALGLGASANNLDPARGKARFGSAS